MVVRNVRKRNRTRQVTHPSAPIAYVSVSNHLPISMTPILSFNTSYFFTTSAR
jgi:hypothetical protein